MLQVLTVLNQVFVAMYLFELLYREKLSVIAVLHHIGTVIIASTAIAIGVNWKHEPDATLEFMLCYVWGMSKLPAHAAEVKTNSLNRCVRRHRRVLAARCRHSETKIQ
jgi:hypothetical protein